MQADQRSVATKPVPANKLTPQEREQIIEICNRPAYSHLPPSQIVPDLLDKGIYIASESSFYRVLKAAGQQHHRGRSVAPKRRAKPTTYTASKPCKVWCWDITYLPSQVRGQFYYLYMYEDIYSRKIVGYEVHNTECGEHAADLIQRCVLAEQCFKKPLVLHSDNGAPMKALTFKAKLEELGIQSSYSRPRVSNDNPFVESMFRTLKYRPQWPSSGFASREAARAWVEKFVLWYNTKHRHSKLNFVTPEQRHNNEDAHILAQRKKVLQAARRQHAERWNGRPVRDCRPVVATTLNPEKDAKEKLAA